jgi:hypothetical protein
LGVAAEGVDQLRICDGRGRDHELSSRPFGVQDS